MHKQRISPKSGQESVWDYPRPPALELCTLPVRVMFAGHVIAQSSRAMRVLETSHPPSYYIPPEDVQQDCLELSDRHSFCEFKGTASYWHLVLDGQRSENAAWSYLAPTSAFTDICDYLCFYASRVEACYVGEEQVQAQEGDFYGGWITSNIVGPFKGGAGTWGW